ncbi:MAG: hypothetical protein KDD51_13155 [Bdellovibrionales bacterium]|nr:hypothetical protein [Bdellovibrionales bacterium]
MLQTLVGLIALSLCSSVFAGKAHREAKKELGANIAAATSAIGTACGSKPKVTVDWKAFDKVKNDKIREVKSNIGHELNYVGEQAKAFCSDADSKALFKSNAKAIEISVTEGDPETTFAKGRFVIKTSSQMNSGGYKFKAILDEW